MYIHKNPKQFKPKWKLLLEDTNHLNSKQQKLTSFRWKLTTNWMSEMSPHRWHYTALLLHGDGKTCAPLDTTVHRARCSVGNFHKFGLCTHFTVHLMPIQWDFSQKESFPRLDPSEELRFASSYCKNTFNTHKKTAFIFTFNRKQKQCETTAHCNEIWNTGYQNLEAQYQIAKRLVLKWECLRLFTYLWQSTLNCKQTPKHILDSVCKYQWNAITNPPGTSNTYYR